jgi:hypothetical protein
MKHTLAKQQLDKFVAYCKEQGISDVRFVIKNGVGDYCPKTQRITLNCKTKAEKQLYVLLHEYGHHCILKDRTLSKKFAALVDRQPNRTLSEQVLSLEEEVLAWHLGEQAAAANDISIDQKKYQVVKARCLRSYIASYKQLANRK